MTNPTLLVCRFELLRIMSAVTAAACAVATTCEPCIVSPVVPAPSHFWSNLILVVATLAIGLILGKRVGSRGPPERLVARGAGRHSASAPGKDELQIDMELVNPALEAELPDFVCTICQTVVWDPVALPCLHIFCASTRLPRAVVFSRELTGFFAVAAQVASRGAEHCALRATSSISESSSRWLCITP